MEAEIEQHSRFFDHLADLIPAKHYHDQESHHIQVRFLGKRQRADAMKAIKLQGRQEKKAKLDPEKALTTLQFQRMLLQKGQKQQSQPFPEVDAADSPAGISTLDHRTGSREDLVERLHGRLQQAKQRRESAKEGRQEHSKAAVKAKEFRQQMRKQTETKLNGKAQQPDNAKRKAPAPDAPAKQSAPTMAAPTQAATEPQPSFTFGMVDVGDADRHAAKKARKASTADLLKEAESKRKLQSAETPEDLARAKEEAWQAALRRARGEKVLDDPKLLRKTQRKEKQMHKKSTKAWQQRLDQQKEQRNAKQEKRQSNLAARTKTKQDHRKAAREKKLLRPGFEGRKNDFISVKKS